MTTPHNLTGQTHGEMRVLGPDMARTDATGDRYWLCQCLRDDCKRIVSVRADNLKAAGKPRACSWCQAKRAIPLAHAARRRASPLTGEDVERLTNGRVTIRSLATKYRANRGDVRKWCRAAGVLDAPLAVTMEEGEVRRAVRLMRAGVNVEDVKRETGVGAGYLAELMIGAAGKSFVLGRQGEAWAKVIDGARLQAVAHEMGVSRERVNQWLWQWRGWKVRLSGQGR